MDTSTFQRARLIPITGLKGDQEQERRATSALLAVMEAVPDFAKTLLKPLGAPAGKTTAFIEPEFIQSEKKVRPDGLIIVERGGKSWSVAVEVKTNKSNLVAEQINAYLDVCRDNNIDALLTISNQVLTLSGAHPTEGIDGRKTRKTMLQHYSWMRILTEAQLQKDHRGISDPEQAWILGELIRYLESPASGALEFTDMGEAWVGVRQAIANGTLSPSDKGATAVAQRFESLLRYTSFKLSARLGVAVTPVATKLAKADPAKHMKTVAGELAANSRLQGSIQVQDTVAPLDITVDLRASQILCSVTVDAPREGRPLTRVSWLLRQLKSSPQGVRIETRVKRGQQASAACLLSEATENPERLVPDDGREITGFVVTLIGAMGSQRGEGRNSFVSSFLNAVELAYQGILENLRPWTPKAPKLPQQAPPHSPDANGPETKATVQVSEPDLADSSAHQATPDDAPSSASGKAHP
jgi:hypothetical protein